MGRGGHGTRSEAEAEAEVTRHRIVAQVGWRKSIESVVRQTGVAPAGQLQTGVVPAGQLQTGLAPAGHLEKGLAPAGHLHTVLQTQDN
jgi:hypothetical protein